MTTNKRKERILGQWGHNRRWFLPAPEQIQTTQQPMVPMPMPMPTLKSLTEVLVLAQVIKLIWVPTGTLQALPLSPMAILTPRSPPMNKSQHQSIVSNQLHPPQMGDPTPLPTSKLQPPVTNPQSEILSNGATPAKKNESRAMAKREVDAWIVIYKQVKVKCEWKRRKRCEIMSVIRCLNGVISNDSLIPILSLVRYQNNSCLVELKTICSSVHSSNQLSIHRPITNKSYVKSRQVYDQNIKKKKEKEKGWTMKHKAKNSFTKHEANYVRHEDARGLISAWQMQNTNHRQPPTSSHTNTKETWLKIAHSNLENDHQSWMSCSAFGGKWKHQAKHPGEKRTGRSKWYRILSK